MGEKFIPNGDGDLEEKAVQLSRAIAEDPQRFGLSQEDSDALCAAVAGYRSALRGTRNRATRCPAATQAKEAARDEAVRVIRRIMHLIRGNEKLDASARVALGLRERGNGPKKQSCPKEAPKLRFVRARHEGNGIAAQHELEFRAADSFKSARPAGAARLELFVDLIPPEEPIPDRPGANLGGRPWYLRSFTRSPIVLMPPMARVPMRIVYWARWADSAGNVGPFSATAVGWVEGGSHQRKLAPFMDIKSRPQIVDESAPVGSAEREPRYRVAVLEAHYEYFNPDEIATPALPEAEMPRLEGPSMSEAA